MSKYSAILFDFGNVIINIDPELTYQAFSSLTGKSLTRIKDKFAESQLFRRYESGHFSDEEFREILRQTLGYPFNDEEIDTAWNSLLLDVPDHRISLILELKKKHKVYLLSNTNGIHIKACDHYFRQRFGIPGVSHLFDQTFYSFEMGMWKPEEEIYQEVLSQTGHAAKEILFIDDNESNISAAKKLGFGTILHDPNDDIINHFQI